MSFDPRGSTQQLQNLPSELEYAPKDSPLMTFMPSMAYSNKEAPTEAANNYSSSREVSSTRGVQHLASHEYGKHDAINDTLDRLCDFKSAGVSIQNSSINYNDTSDRLQGLKPAVSQSSGAT